MTLDFIAKRYGVLPSKVMMSGDSIDVRCANLAVMYESYLVKKQKSGLKDKSDHGFTQEELIDMMERTKRNGNKNNKKSN